MKSLRERILNGEAVFGTQTFIGNPIAAEILGGLGYDFMFIDTEHTVFNMETLYAVVCAAESAGTPAFVRAPEKDVTYTIKVTTLASFSATKNEYSVTITAPVIDIWFVDAVDGPSKPNAR